MADAPGDCSRSQSPFSPSLPDGLNGHGGPVSIPTHHGQVPTHSAKFAICFTASTAPGRGSSSMKKFLDSQMLMAFSCEGKENSYCTSC